MATAYPDPRKPQNSCSTAAREHTAQVSATGTRRPVTLVIRAFVNDDGELYGVVDEPSARTRWQAKFSHLVELVELVCARLPGEETRTVSEAGTCGEGGVQAQGRRGDMEGGDSTRIEEEYPPRGDSAAQSPGPV